MRKMAAMMLLIGLVALSCARANANSKGELVSPWLRNMEIPVKIRRQLVREAESISRQGYYQTVFLRTVSYLPSITRNAARMGVSPWPAIGITEYESSGRLWAVDYLSMAGRSKTTHVGAGQFSEDLLPEAVRNDPKRLACQRKYLRTHKQVDLAAWARRDPRFDPDWASRAICYSLRRNTEQTGHSTLGVQSHNSGLRGQQNTLVAQAAAWDTDIQYWGASSFVEKEGLNYFILLAQKGTAFRSWQRKGENHGYYCFKVAVRQEAFARWIRRNKRTVSCFQMAMLFPGNGQTIYLAKRGESKKMIARNINTKPVAAGAVSSKMDMDVSKAFKEETKVGFVHIALGWIAKMASLAWSIQIWPWMKYMAYHGGCILKGLAIPALFFCLYHFGPAIIKRSFRAMHQSARSLRTQIAGDQPARRKRSKRTERHVAEPA